MTGRKVDFVVERSEELQEAAIELRAGTHVMLSSDESTGNAQVHCEGQVLGKVPADQQQQLRGSSCNCTVRSVKKQDGKITQILVRAVLSSSDLKRLADLPAVDSTQPEELEGTTQLPQHQLELLVNDESLRGMLKDERLQKEILAIDTANDREKALQQHFQGSEFKAFTDKVLGIVAASQLEAQHVSEILSV